MGLLLAACGIGVLMAPGPAATAAAAERRMAETFDIYLGGLRLAEMRIDVRYGLGGDRAEAGTTPARAAKSPTDGTVRPLEPPRPAGGDFAATAWLQTASVARLLVDAGFTVVSEGRITAEGLEPRSFAADSYDSRKSQRVEIGYRAGRLSEIEATPPFKPKPWEVDPVEAGTVPDPLTAALIALVPREAPDGTGQGSGRGQLCDRTVGVFDGRKRYEIVLGAPEAEPDGMIRCPALYRRLAGFKPDKMEDPEWPFAMWFDQGDDGVPRFQRAQGSTPFGTAAILRRDG